MNIYMRTKVALSGLGEFKGTDEDLDNLYENLWAAGAEDVEFDGEYVFFEAENPLKAKDLINMIKEWY